MSQHGRRRAAAEAPAPVQRYAGLTIETALVLMLVVVIAAGSVLVNTIAPTERETRVLVGDKKVRVVQVGQGGVMPGPLQPVVLPPVVATPDPALVLPVVEKPRKVKKPKATPTPTPTPTVEPVETQLPGLPGDDDDEQDCTLGLFCSPKAEPESPVEESGEIPVEEEPVGDEPAAPKKKPKNPAVADPAPSDPPVDGQAADPPAPR